MNGRTLHKWLYNRSTAGDPQNSEGFTLVEVVVSIIILTVSFVLILQLFSSGLRASRLSCDYTRAVVHARDKMEELHYNPVQESGQFDDGFRWESEITSYKKLEGNTYNLKKLKVKIYFPDNSNIGPFELVGLKSVLEME